MKKILFFNALSLRHGLGYWLLQGLLPFALNGLLLLMDPSGAAWAGTDGLFESNQGTITAPAAPAENSSSAAVEDSDASADLWDRIRAGFGLTPDPADPLVARHEAWFAARPDYVERTMERSRMYLFFIVEEAQKRNMPLEIALLPIVESAFNPHALSRSQASGMWQFIPSTGKIFGLQQDWWYDGRRDVVAATTSALDYLHRLHEEFGSWELALAGYNCGEGKVRREIAYNSARNLPTGYHDLNLPDETRNYIPKLLAARAVVSHPDQFGLILPPIPDEPFFAAVTTHRRIDTKVAAEMAGMSTEDFLMLNPGFNRPIISLDFNQEKTILVPVAVATIFAQKLDDPGAKLISWKAHRLQRGEALDQVASRYGLSGAELKRINGIASNRQWAGGGMILVPEQGDSPRVPEVEPVNVASLRPEAEVPAPPPPSHPHKVHPGDKRKLAASRASTRIRNQSSGAKPPRTRPAPHAKHRPSGSHSTAARIASAPRPHK